MRITDIQISNYKSFSSSPLLQFQSGFNVVVGKNNVGKTALVEAISLRLQQKAHLSEESLPRKDTPPYGSSSVSIRFELDRSEFIELLADRLPIFLLPHSRHITGDLVESFSRTLNQKVHIDYTFRPDPGFISANLTPFYENESVQSNTSGYPAYQFQIERPNLSFKLLHDNITASPGTSVAFQIAYALRERIYCFRAERLNVGQSEYTSDTELKPDASNLASVLHDLQNRNRSRYDRLMRHVGAIFPEIKYVTTPRARENPNIVRIYLWSIDTETEREDLAIPLQESGTGIGQVLAILYVIVTSDYPRTIIIDEPQSFLHPGAIRKLMGILQQEYSQHQYIVTTHSPTVVTTVNPRTILLIQKEGAKSVVDTVDVREAQKLRLYLTEIGARLADVFGADDILWVEGPTEELCFPIILERLKQKSLMGTAIIGVKHTGDFQGKHKQLALDIYNRLSTGRGLLPPAVGFLFDREGLSQKDILDLERQSKGRMYFLSRRMYENYLLHPTAIAHVMNRIDGFRETPVEPAEITMWLDVNGWSSTYIPNTVIKTEERGNEWFANVDGAKILKALFSDLSETRVAYDNKPVYGQELTNWLLEHDPENLAKIANLLDSILSPNR